MFLSFPGRARLFWHAGKWGWTSFSAFPTGGETWLLASPGASGQESCQVLCPASPAPVQLCAWCRRLPITSPLLLRPQLLPRVLRDCGWAAPHSRVRRCVWLVSSVLPPVAAFPAMTLLPSMVAGSTLPLPSDSVFSPTGSPRCPWTTRSPRNAWIAGKRAGEQDRVWRLGGRDRAVVGAPPSWTRVQCPLHTRLL